MDSKSVRISEEDGRVNPKENSQDTRSRKRRRILSCESCRKLKTRCDKNAVGLKCHRCAVLRIECSLDGGGEAEPSEVKLEKEMIAAEPDKVGVDKDVLKLILNKLERFETTINELKQNVKELESQQRFNTGAFHHEIKRSSKRTSNSTPRESFVSNTSINNSIDNIQLDFYVSSAPLKMINEIDNVLLQKSNDYESFQRLCDDFIDLFKQNKSKFLKLAKSFLKISHFWIIPGGIKKINSKYVFEHPFISCIFVLIGMCFDQNDTYVEEQKILFDLAMKLLGKALLIDKLTDHDIEAIIYISTFNITRKTDTSQFTLNKWLITTFAMNHIVLAFNFQEIFVQIMVKKIFDKDQLFHMRVYNSLLISSLQASLDCNRPVFITNDYLNFAKIILKFPEDMILVGDRIIISKLYLLFTIVNLINDEKFSIEVLNDVDKSTKYIDPVKQLLKIPDLEQWKVYNRTLIKSDVAKILLNAFYYYHIYLSKRILKDLELKHKLLYPLQNKMLSNKQWKNLTLLQNVCFKTSIKYCFKLLQNALDLNVYFIKGSPIFQNDQIIYASLTLLQSLSLMSCVKNKKMSIELIGKIYWKLNRLGINKNDATDTLEKVLKLIIDAAIKDHNIVLQTNVNHERQEGMQESEVEIFDEDDELYKIYPDIIDAYSFANSDSESDHGHDNTDTESETLSPHLKYTFDLRKRATSFSNHPILIPSPSNSQRTRSYSDTSQSVPYQQYHPLLNQFYPPSPPAQRAKLYQRQRSQQPASRAYQTLTPQIQHTSSHPLMPNGYPFFSNPQMHIYQHPNESNTSSPGSAIGYQQINHDHQVSSYNTMSSSVESLPLQGAGVLQPEDQKIHIDQPEALMLFNVDQTILDSILLPNTSDYDNFSDFYHDLLVNNDIDETLNEPKKK